MYLLPRRFFLYKTSSVVVIFVLPAFGQASQETVHRVSGFYFVQM